MKIVNAKIKYSYLGFDDNGELTIELGFDCALGTISTGKYCPSFWKSSIEMLLNTLELQRWEDLPRKYARIEINDKNEIIRIGNVIEDKWVMVG